MSISSDLNQVAIIGRPNVGKSTLFNILTRSRKSMVRNQPGVTRDFIVGETNWWGHDFSVVDTGGLTDDKSDIIKQVKKQVLHVLKEVDLVVAVMDGVAGLTPEDRDIVQIAKESKKPFIIVVNKIDRFQEAEFILSEFYEFGYDLIPTSFEKRDGVDRIVEWIKDNSVSKDVEETNKIRISILGKPNAGKSSLGNHLLGQDRLIVSPMAGTTVDNIESDFKFNAREYTLVDTAGIRRASKREEGIEFISAIKSFGSIGKADIVLLLIDGLLGPTVQDAKIVNEILAKHKPVILVATKSDLTKNKHDEGFRKWFRSRVDDVFHFYPDIPVAFISNLTGHGVKGMFKVVEDVWDKINIKIKTSHINKFLLENIKKTPLPMSGTKKIKFYYMIQTHQKPPSFILFTNYPEGVNPSYRRFLINKLKEEYNLYGIPIRIFCMGKKIKNAKGRKKEIIENNISLVTEESLIPDDFDINNFEPEELGEEFQDMLTEDMTKFQTVYDLNGDDETVGDEDSPTIVPQAEADDPVVSPNS